MADRIYTEKISVGFVPGLPSATIKERHDENRCDEERK